MRTTTGFASMTAAALLALAQPSVAQEEPDDLRRYDGRLADTMVMAGITRRADGMYEYSYSILSPSSNKGSIASFELDISCDADAGSVTFTEPDDPIFNGDNSTVPHVPVQLHGKGNASSSAVSPTGWAVWSMSIPPGSDARSVRIISPGPPATRIFLIRPDMNAYPQTPRRADFTVTGFATGPACERRKPG